MHIRNFCKLLYILLFLRFDRTFGQGDGKIKGGHAAKNGEYPYLGLLAGGNACGCGFITLKKIVTAAHCIKLTVSPDTFIDLKTSYVFAGSVKLADQDDGQMTQMSDYLIHPKYKPRGDGKMLYDIATANLVKAFTQNSQVKPMAIPSGDETKFQTLWSNFLASGKTCRIMGWGAESVTFVKGQPVPGQPSPVLKTTEIRPLSVQECKRWQGPGADVIDMGYHCFMGVEHGEMPLFGDSGSPLECDGLVYGIATAVTFSTLNPEKPTPFYYVLFGNYLKELGIGSGAVSTRTLLTWTSLFFFILLLFIY